MKPNSYDQTSGAPSPETTIRGTVDFLDVKDPVSDATVHIRLQDTSRADSPATTVAEQVIDHVNIVPDGQPLPFTLQMPANKVSRGDYVSTQSYPVDMNDEQSGITIVVRRVG